VLERAGVERFFRNTLIVVSLMRLRWLLARSNANRCWVLIDTILEGSDASDRFCGVESLTPESPSTADLYILCRLLRR